MENYPEFHRYLEDTWLEQYNVSFTYMNFFGEANLPFVGQRLVINGSLEVWKLDARDVGGAGAVHSTTSIDEDTVHATMR